MIIKACIERFLMIFIFVNYNTFEIMQIIVLSNYPIQVYNPA